MGQTMVMPLRSKRWPAYLGKALLLVWGVALTTAVLCWGAWHYAVLSGPHAGAVAGLMTSSETNHWRMVHVLASECGCSAAVGKRLANRHAQPGIAEEVWLVGDAPALTAALQQAGFKVSVKSAEALAQDTKIEGMPWLLIARPSGPVVYSGGYAAQNPATVAQLEDLKLLQRLKNGETPEAFPAFGCATSRRAQQSFDPLGLKYSRR
jgi:hypothetical protein